jgi:hypothetical protein
LKLTCDFFWTPLSIFVYIEKRKLMKRIYTIFVFGLLILSSVTKSYAQVSIDAEFRPRTEFRSGFNQPLADTLKAAAFTLQRTRLNFSYKSASINTSLVVQDSRIFGETDIKQPSTASNGSLGIYEAWAELLLNKNFSFKIGRQSLQFEDGRIFSKSTWSNTGNSHDLAQFRYAAGGFDVQLGYAFGNQKIYNADSVFYNVSKMYRQLAFLHLSKTISEGVTMSLLGIDEGFEKSKTNLNLYHRYTAGGTFQLKKSNLPLGIFATAYYQFGKSTPTVDLNAFLLAIKASYQFTGKLSGFGGADYYSGSESTLPSSKTNTFNKLPYGSNHSNNGYMEYWASLPKGGLFDCYLGVGLKMSNKLSSGFSLHNPRLIKNMKVGMSDVPKNLGSELDIEFNYQFSPEAFVQFAWCGYWVTDGTQMLKQQPASLETKFPQYTYLMLTIKPQFYKTPVTAEP